MKVRLITLCLVLLVCLSKQVPDILLGLAHVLVQHLWPIDHFSLLPIQHLANLSGNKRLARSGGTKQKHALDVLDTQLLDNAGREHARGKGTAEDGFKLLVQATDAELLKVHLLGLEELRVGEALLARDLDGVAARVGEEEGGVVGEHAALYFKARAIDIHREVCDGELEVAMACQIKSHLLAQGECLALKAPEEVLNEHVRVDIPRPPLVLNAGHLGIHHADRGGGLPGPPDDQLQVLLGSHAQVLALHTVDRNGARRNLRVKRNLVNES
mmetsp:Transcript_17439/g.48457  ORF Transcript_17439/g.48457 Transcript_17439/m.48457 type:complete len:271 (-) Transcript_17439:277-1089(-)